MPSIKTVIYLDELLLVNFVASAVFLLGAGLGCGQRCTPARLAAGAAVGALSNLALLGPEWPGAGALLYKAAVCAAMVALGYGWPGWRAFLRLCAWVLGLALALTGAALLPGAGVQQHNLSVYAPLSPTLLLGCCAGVYTALRAVQWLCPRGQAACFAAELELGGRRMPVRAFYDTGFALQDAAGGRAVILVRYEDVRGQLAAPLRAYLDAHFAGGAAVPPAGLGVRFVPCGTVAGRCVLPAVPAEALVRRAGGRSYRLAGPLAAFGARLPAAEWSVLLGADAAGGLGF